MPIATTIRVIAIASVLPSADYNLTKAMQEATMSLGTLDFEEDFLQRRLHDLAVTHPAHAALIRDLLDALDYNKAVLKDRGGMRNLVFTLGSKLAKQPKTGSTSWQGWVERLASDGAISSEKADALIVQAQVLSMTKARS